MWQDQDWTAVCLVLSLPFRNPENRMPVAAKPQPYSSSLPLPPVVQVQAWTHVWLSNVGRDWPKPVSVAAGAAQGWVPSPE